MHPLPARPYELTGYQMINEVEIRNFRLFEHLTVSDCRRVNVIVGDNGAGKTTLLEAIFLALGSSTELGARYRTFRGLAGSFNGPARRIEEAIWRDYFYMGEWLKREIFIETKGSGEESRSVRVTHAPSQLFIPLTSAGSVVPEEATSAPLRFIWRDSSNHEHAATPTVSLAGIKFEGTEEDLPDFFYFATGTAIGSIENAARFSELSQSGKLHSFVEMFTTEYPIIKDLSLEVVAGAPIIFATLKDNNFRLPVANVSGGINRMIGVMLGIASRPKSVVLVDEVDEGIYYKHQTAIWRGLLSLVKQNDSQLFTTTHNEEWLESLTEAAGKDVDDIAIWRIEQEKQKPVLHQLKGKRALLGIRSGGVR